MKKAFFLLVALSTVLGTTACTSLPDGAQKPEFKITDLTFTSKNNVQGFDVTYTVMHRSPAPLPVDSMQITVYLNNQKAAAFNFEPETLIPPYHENTYVQFVPANLLHKVSQQSLTTSPMLKLQGKAEMSLNIVDDEDKAFLNQHYVYEGLIHAAGE